MKSKKIIAMIVAFAAFMAVATSGFAAVTTTTTYNNIADKVEVDVDVTGATAGSEVTYLVKSNNAIVYIDQKTADENGAVGFDYKIAKTKIAEDLTTSVQFGTNGAAAIDGTDKAIELANVTVDKDANATIKFFKDQACAEEIGATAIVGDGDKIYAQVTVAQGFEIDTVSGLINGSGNVYEVDGNAVKVTTKATYVEPDVVEPEQEELKAVISENVKAENAEGVEVDAVAYTKVLKVVGQPTAVGIIHDNVKYPAMKAGANYDNDTLYAVRLIFADGTVVTSFETYAE